MTQFEEGDEVVLEFITGDVGHGEVVCGDIDETTDEYTFSIWGARFTVTEYWDKHADEDVSGEAVVEASISEVPGTQWYAFPESKVEYRNSDDGDMTVKAYLEDNNGV